MLTEGRCRGVKVAGEQHQVRPDVAVGLSVHSQPRHSEGHQRSDAQKRDFHAEGYAQAALARHVAGETRRQLQAAGRSGDGRRSRVCQDLRMWRVSRVFHASGVRTSDVRVGVHHKPRQLRSHRISSIRRDETASK
eukprot:scaffold7342_cov269-Pinguiococcus_pyrenoidosus.AAC.11